MLRRRPLFLPFPLPLDHLASSERHNKRPGHIDLLFILKDWLPASARTPSTIYEPVRFETRKTTIPASLSASLVFVLTFLENPVVAASH
ncbi:hypothetical protein AOQ84DRAFT_351861 [Glonium stellatum]|uniref:Uncharacterized protein n=1 Tax=Glonium stellatum TaxID=574774 RepID=A0A8E2JYD9_9PEZI|nr:hypothetical protein AOQ84DRAFT_351861 [Glonium stellatum]